MRATVRHSILFVAVAAALSVAAACRGPKGDQGDPGPTGSPGPTGQPTPGTAGVGTVLTLNSAAVLADRSVQVEFHLADSAGIPRDISDVTVFWTIAVLTSNLDGTTDWSNYITQHVSNASGSAQTDQPTFDSLSSPGTYEYLGSGDWRYTFSTPLPSGYDATMLHRIGAWASRTASDGSEEASNDGIVDFVPNGAAAYPARELVSTDACNGCHNPMQAHGGFRTEVKLCATCHTAQLFDPDTFDTATMTIGTSMNPLKLDTLIHRIHRGERLPSLVAASTAGVVGAKFSVVGYMGHESIYGETIADGPDAGTLPDIEGVAYPQNDTYIAGQSRFACTKCHTGGAQSGGWAESQVTRRSCTSCHDTQWFGNPAAVPPRMTAHVGGPLTDDTMCENVGCHTAHGTEFDISIEGSHQVPHESAGLRGIDFGFVAVTGTAGGNPSIVFTLANHDDGSPILPPLSTALAGLTANVGGPTTDYLFQNVISLNLRTLAVYNSTSGTYSASWPNRAATDAYFPSGPVIPAGSTGTFAVGVQATRNVVVNGRTIVEAALNPVQYFSVDGSPVVPRRKKVELNNCNDGCHDQIAIHGGGRTNTEYCVICHDPTASDWARRPKTAGNTNIAGTDDKLEERSIDFKQLIHRIHTGDKLAKSQPFDVYGFSGIVQFGGVRFPGDRTQCLTCHVDDGYTVDNVPLNAVWPVVNETGTILHSATAKHGVGESVIGPIQAACLGCHDTLAARAHAEIMTSNGVESCIVCHGESADFSVTKVHAVK